MLKYYSSPLLNFSEASPDAWHYPVRFSDTALHQAAKARTSHILHILPYYSLLNAEPERGLDFGGITFKRFRGDIHQRDHTESFWVGEQTLPKGRLKQGLVASDSSCTELLQQEYPISSTA